MGYFKYTEDILEMIETNKYYQEAQKELQEYFKEKEKRDKVEPYFVRYYIYLKIYSELTFKVNLFNELFELKNDVLKEFILIEKNKLKISLCDINLKIEKLKKMLLDINFEFKDNITLTIVDKNRIKGNVRDYIINFGIQYLNESTYQDPKNMFADFKSLIYWGLSIENNLTYSTDLDIKYYLSKSDFHLVECNVCHRMTPSECCYCMHCNKLCGE